MLKSKILIKAFLSALIILLMIPSVYARILIVGHDSEFKTVSNAAKKAVPGDTIMIKPGTYSGGEVISGLKGRSNGWIVIKSEVTGGTTFAGGSNAMQFSDPEYIVIDGLTFTRQTGNGVNIDDGGSYETPARHIIIKNCKWEIMEATGNNDELKMSGVDDFEISNCTFLNGSKGGSLIDMVGCHRGIITNNLFGNGGSNSVQAKGGSRDIVICRNRFNNAGERAINIGGSTGLPYFRPVGTQYEASEIKVWSNIITGGTSAMAFVGAINCEVVNNTIINPIKWVLRILQENNGQGMQSCNNNSFINNLIVFTGRNLVAVNIGPGTRPETFTFSNNLWHNPDDFQWSGPKTPVTESGQILNKDPEFADDEYRLKVSSPASGSGYPVQFPEYDFFNKRYNKKRSIGAVEAINTKRSAER